MKQQSAPSNSQRSDKHEKERRNKSENKYGKLVGEAIGSEVGSAHKDEGSAICARGKVKHAAE